MRLVACGHVERTAEGVGVPRCPPRSVLRALHMSHTSDYVIPTAVDLEASTDGSDARHSIVCAKDGSRGEDLLENVQRAVDTAIVHIEVGQEPRPARGDGGYQHALLSCGLHQLSGVQGRSSEIEGHDVGLHPGRVDDPPRG